MICVPPLSEWPTDVRTARVMILLAVLWCALPAQAQTADSVRHPSPRGALWRAAAVPGWGQVYNHQYYKLPVVYLGLGFLTVTTLNLHRDYILYREAFQYKAFQELVDSGAQETNPKAQFKSSYDRLAAKFGPISSSPIRSRRDNLRRNRDLTILGIGLVYSLQILDAFVSAHLADFDVGEDLSLRIMPSVGGVTAKVHLAF